MIQVICYYYIWDYLLHLINWREYADRTLLDDEPYVVDLNTSLTGVDFGIDKLQGNSRTTNTTTNKGKIATRTKTFSVFKNIGRQVP